MVSILDRAIDSDKQRIKRTEDLLSQLYRKDVTPTFHAPAMRGVKFMAVLSVVAVLVFTGTLFFKFNNFIYLREDVLTKMGNLESAIQRRSNLFTNMVNLTLNHASLEHTIFAETARTRSDIVRNSGLPNDVQKQLLDKAQKLGAAGALPKGWEDALAAFKGGGPQASLGRLMAVVEKYPDIQSAKTYQHMMTSLINMEDLITERRMEYNKTLHMYNTAISRFPWKLLADWTSFKRYEYYTISKPGPTAPVISSDTYKQLVPFYDEGSAK